MLRFSFRILFMTIFIVSNAGAQSVPYSSGRIVISSDGNEHDHDDWSATPLSLALIAARGLQDKLTVYTFSNHVWGSNHDHPDALEEMRISALEGGKRFGFKNTRFIEAVTFPDSAVAAIVGEINRSSEADPLYIIEAGPMEIVGRALSAAEKDKLSYVRLISHSRWNDNHADRPARKWEEHQGWTWDRIKSDFASAGLICDHIRDQNGGQDYTGMRAPFAAYDWLKDEALQSFKMYQDGNQDWLLGRLEKCRKNGEYDPSDSGMIVYLFTGIMKTSPEDARDILENPVE